MIMSETCDNIECRVLVRHQ